MSDFEVGKWYGWNGQAGCPVHPETFVECYSPGVKGSVRSRAKYRGWHVVDAFRIIEEHKEPREWWALWTPSGGLVGHFTQEKATNTNRTHYEGKGEIIHIREVLDE